MLSNYLISSDEVFFTYSRDAIIQILTKIDPFKEKEIILPQYICSTVIDIIISWSDNITFYNVNDNFKFKDSEILKILNSKNNAILFLVDFFGVETQVSKKLMKEINDKKIILIRDAAHSFLTLYERRLNYSTTFNCDYIVTSIYKSIGTNVGALAVGIQGKNFINAYLFFKRFFINNLKFFLINFRFFNNNFLHRQRDMKIIDQSSLKKYPPINFYSIFRKFYLNIDYEELIKDKKNLSIIIFEKLKNRIECQSVFSKKEIQKNTLMAFPVLFDTERNRNIFLKKAYDNGVQAQTWPTFHSKSVSRERWGRLVLIPLNKDIDKLF